MLSLLDQVQNGTVNPQSLVVAETTRRMLSLELSKHRDLEQAHSGAVNTIDIETVENRYLLSGGSSGSITIHDLCNLKGQPHYTCKVICKIDKKSRFSHSYSVDTVQWYPFDTGLFSSSGMDNKLIVWDTNTLKPADTYVLPGKVFRHHMSSIATTHSLVAVASSKPQAVLVDLRTGAHSHELRGHVGPVVSIQWSPVQEYLLSTGGADNRLFLWDIRCAKGYLKALDQHNGKSVGSKRAVCTAHNGVVNSLCFTPDGLYLVSYGTDSRLRLWDVALGQNTLVNYGKLFNDSPKGMQLDLCYDSCPPVIFVPTEGKVIVLDMFSGLELNTLLGHFNCVNCCALHSWYHDLYSGGNDRNILLWTPDGEQELLFADDMRDRSVGKKESKFVLKMPTADAWSSDED